LRENLAFVTSDTYKFPRVGFTLIRWREQTIALEEENFLFVPK
jgi:hypothetical protein